MNIKARMVANNWKHTRRFCVAYLDHGINHRRVHCISRGLSHRIALSIPYQMVQHRTSAICRPKWLHLDIHSVTRRWTYLQGKMVCSEPPSRINAITTVRRSGDRHRARTFLHKERAIIFYHFPTIFYRLWFRHTIP